jgi:hypothetical protein
VGVTAAPRQCTRRPATAIRLSRLTNGLRTRRCSAGSTALVASRVWKWAIIASMCQLTLAPGCAVAPTAVNRLPSRPVNCVAVENGIDGVRLFPPGVDLNQHCAQTRCPAGACLAGGGAEEGGLADHCPGGSECRIEGGSIPAARLARRSPVCDPARPYEPPSVGVSGYRGQGPLDLFSAGQWAQSRKVGNPKLGVRVHFRDHRLHHECEGDGSR